MRRHAAIAGLLLVLVAPATAWAGAAADQIRSQIDRTLTSLEARQGRVALRRIAEEVFDVDEMTRRALGRHWQGRTDSEREEIVRLFGDLLERNYLAQIERYAGERIQVVGEMIDGDHATVRTRVVTKQGAEIPVDYRLMRRAERWVAYDVIIEGVSLIANYRAQFNKIIQTSSYQRLVERLRVKQDERVETRPLPGG